MSAVTINAGPKRRPTVTRRPSKGVRGPVRTDPRTGAVRTVSAAASAAVPTGRSGSVRPASPRLRSVRTTSLIAEPVPGRSDEAHAVRPVRVGPVRVQPESWLREPVRPGSRRAAPARGVSAQPVGVARRPAPVRLTRRGRLLLVILFLGLMFTVLTMFGSHSAATGEAGTPVPTRTVEVGQGDTLWDIAAQAAPSGQVRDMVHRIEELNALTGPGVTVGQELAVPLR